MAKVDPGGPITERADVVELLDKVPLTKLEQDAPKQVCCLTGATSLVGAHVVRRLLRAGHTVHAPIRGGDDAPRLGYLKAIKPASRYAGADADRHVVGRRRRGQEPHERRRGAVQPAGLRGGDGQGAGHRSAAFYGVKRAAREAILPAQPLPAFMVKGSPGGDSSSAFA